jgi:Sugar transferases involved in lipopolysaccharide synthesis
MESLTKDFQAQVLSISIAYCGATYIEELNKELLKNGIVLYQFDDIKSVEKYFYGYDIMTLPDALIIEVRDQTAELLSFISKLKENPVTKNITIVLLVLRGDRKTIIEQFSSLVYDIYFYPFTAEHIVERLGFMHKLRMIGNLIPHPNERPLPYSGYRMPWSKRLFDIVVSLTALFFSLPITVLIAILIKLDSKGPIFYKSQRAGTGYKVFDFYKFRSMRVNADKELAALSQQLNQYAESDEQAAFVKIKNDPRITRLGQTLRNTSLDEIPQLINVLKGDMSLVGNRPLPLYEAQQLTSDEWAARFLGPAGITGLWQVSKRGKGEMSDKERRQLDNYYIENFSFWMDLKILLRTIPALFQKENV